VCAILKFGFGFRSGFVPNAGAGLYKCVEGS
jgi:hypothetical protein